MRRATTLMFCSALAVALAIPVAALALARVLHGPAGPGQSASVDVQFNIKKGRPTKITRFELNNIPASCRGYPPTAVSATFSKHIPVSAKRRFHASETTNYGRVTYTVTGRFSSLHKAAGKLQVKGTVPGCMSADTGTVHWSATG